ncbi:LOW QUALITY PROTEIN: disease resistance protein RPM1 [Populus trichocarpa]|uniref:LOW QUALITY PROTEIN: disease resistance protein RPM1 n=1 Tax=Populus trichocarpa TaxID=3694 RepID=UPI002279A591|nr:LOW QUALITY PROTEIN: disease resistance protein RPM1 [Populus trichocarpa]
MTEGLVTFLLSKLADFIQEEERLLTGVKAEAEYIRDELEFMVVFLRAADAMEEKDDGLKVLVQKVRDVAYDMEDTLDHFRLRLTHDHGDKFCSSVQTISNSIITLKARRQIASKIQALKSRVINISEAHRRYLIRNNIMEPSSSSTHTPRVARPGNIVEEANIVGIEKPKKLLIGWLVRGRSEREVISWLEWVVWVKPHWVWITLSPSFKEEDLLKDIIQQLFRVLQKNVPQGMDNDRLKTAINRFLQKKRYLIVLDDVWHADAWDAFEPVFPNNSRGSHILLTTRKTEVALTACIEFPDKVYNLDPLSPEESWTLFCKMVFQNSHCPEHLKNVSERILGRCEGLPLAIEAMSGVLATRDRSKIDEWEKVCLSLGAGFEDNNRMRNALKILSLSYYDLPYYLKSCLLYFSMFPEGIPIQRMRLIRLWIAEGFVKGREGMTSEEVAEDFLNELIKRSLVQVVEATSYGQVKTCRIHDLLREILITKAKEQDFVAIAKEQNMIWSEKVRRVSIHNDMPSMRQIHVASRLRSLLVFWGKDYFPGPPKFISPSRSRLLTVLDMEGTPLKEFPNEVVSLIFLKYLSLRNTKVNSVPSSISKLQNLESLDLKHAQVTELPVDILKLQKLRHLLVYRYETHESDDQIRNKHGFKAPAQIGNLLSVQKLCFLEADQGQKLMSELGRLIHLRRLGILKFRKEDGKDLCSSIDKLTNLRALSVTSITESEVIDLEYLSSPPQFLQRLYLTGRLERLPDWILSLDSLVKLVLKWSRLREDPLLFLQNLPNLVHLELIQVYSGEALHFSNEGFEKLKVLGLNKLERLKSITVQKGALPSLQKLVVQGCKLLQKVPSGIKHLAKLKTLDFFDMPYDFVKRLRPDGTAQRAGRTFLQKSVVQFIKIVQILPFDAPNDFIRRLHPDGDGEDYHEVRNVPEIYCTYQKNGNWEIYYNYARPDILLKRQPDWKP